MKDKPQVGNVIMSPKFVYGEHSTSSTGEKCVRSNGTSYEKSAYEKRRAAAKFVVELVYLSEGGGGHGPGDEFPSQRMVEARRLTKNDVYDPNGELVCFSVGCIEPKDLKLVGKMERTFVWAK